MYFFKNDNGIPGTYFIPFKKHHEIKGQKRYERFLIKSQTLSLDYICCLGSYNFGHSTNFGKLF